MATFDRATQPYTAFFCEENVWQLARLLDEAAMGTAQALFISNRAGSVRMTNQRAARPGYGITWDYHVVLRVRDGDDLILDADTRLDYPCPTGIYLEQSFPPQAMLPQPYRASVRVVPARQFVRRFHSDRNHMHDRLPPSAFPRWPTIGPDDPRDAIPLQRYLDIDDDLGDGSRVLTLDALYRELA
ncbi:MAG: hypothetical protein KDJ39_08650 [Gammaproteobacteria bacterium]|nr:hypothetical protein [Gammaproteobacteria bacterium]MCP5298915.1 hypothetical protein [Chromatiaceae bacterium]